MKIATFLLFFVMTIPTILAQGPRGAKEIFQSARFNYVTFAPKIIRPGTKLTIATIVINPDWIESIFTYELLDASDMAVSKADNFFPPGSLKITELRIPENLDPKQHYDLKLNIQGPKVDYTVIEKRRLQINLATAGLFIQLDKPIYKADDIVRWRIVAIMPDLTPYKGQVSVYLVNPKGQRVAQWLVKSSKVGILEEDISLGLYPIIGNYILSAVVVNSQTGLEGKPVEKSFEVSNKELPIFEVKIDLAPFQVLNKDIPCVIDALYKFGEAVASQGTLSIRFDKNPSCQRTYQQTIKLPKGTIELNIPFKKIAEICSSPLVGILLIEVKITDTASGIETSGLAPTKFFENPIKLEFSPSNPSSFKPNLPYVGYVKITQPDGKVLFDHSENVLIKAAGDSKGTNLFFTQKFTINIDGNVAFNIPIPPALTSLYIFAELEVSKVGAISHIENVQYSNTNSYMSLSLKTSEPRAGENAVFNLLTSHPTQEIFYIILSRGSIVYAGFVNVAGNTSKLFYIPLTKDMAPLARIVAFQLKNGEVIVDALNFKVHNFFKNYVDAKFDKFKLAPGKESALEILTHPTATVCVLSLDKKLAIYSQLYDFTPQDVLNSLLQFDTTVSAFKLIQEKGTLISVSVGGLDNVAIIEQSGLIIYSDADLEFPKSAGDSNCPKGDDCTFTPMVASGELIEELGHIRKFFPDTWNWQCQETPTGQLVIKDNAPDYLTYWITSVFSMHPTLGLSLLDAPIELQVAKEFFTYVKTPPHVIMGEFLIVRVVVFNYSPETIKSVIVELEENSMVENIYKNGVNKPGTRKSIVQAIISGGSGVIQFPIKPIKLGIIDLIVHSQAVGFTDSVERSFEVRAPGMAIVSSDTLFIDLKRYSTCKKRESHQYSQIYPLLPLPGLLPGTLRIEISVSGDLLGPVMRGLMDDKFLQYMPQASAEQNLIYFGPLIYVFRYLMATNQLEQSFRVKGLTIMRKAYMIQMGFQRAEGPFATFPIPKENSIDSGSPKAPQFLPSTWLTAFVIKLFKQATPFIYIDQNIIKSALKWIITTQHPAGYFRDEGKLLLESIQGKDMKNTVSLTGFVAITLIENKNFSKEIPELINTLNKAILFLETNLGLMHKEPYRLSIVCYALALSNSPKALDCITLGQKFAIQTNEHLYWLEELNGRLSIEMSAYFLLTYLTLNQMPNAVKVSRWLITQQDQYGSFQSTQDTVVALQALALYSEMTYCPNPSFTVELEFGQVKIPFKIHKTNALLYQTITLPIPSIEPKELTIKAMGQGAGLIQIVKYYNVEASNDKNNEIIMAKEVGKPVVQPNIVKVNGDKEIVTLATTTTTTLPTSSITPPDITTMPVAKIVPKNLPFSLLIITVASEHDLAVRACTRWNLNKPNDSGLTALEMGTPSGFRPDIESVELIDDLASVKEINEKLVFYLNKVEGKQLCIKYKLKRVDLVGQQQPVPCKIYQYYNPEMAIVKFLDAVTEKIKSVCDLCTSNCQDTCPDIKKPTNSRAIF